MHVTEVASDLAAEQQDCTRHVDRRGNKDEPRVTNDPSNFEGLLVGVRRPIVDQDIVAFDAYRDEQLRHHLGLRRRFTSAA